MTPIVNFETAKLLKEKGFDKIGKFYYPDDGSLLNKNKNSNRHSAYRMQAPTIAEAVMWLYEEHGIWVVVNVGKPHLSKSCMFFANVIKFGLHHKNKFRTEFYNTPTEAYEFAIIYTLKNLL
jgi:hypothetical protein